MLAKVCINFGRCVISAASYRVHAFIIPGRLAPPPESLLENMLRGCFVRLYPPVIWFIRDNESLSVSRLFIPSLPFRHSSFDEETGKNIRRVHCRIINFPTLSLMFWNNYNRFMLCVGFERITVYSWWLTKAIDLILLCSEVCDSLTVDRNIYFSEILELKIFQCGIEANRKNKNFPSQKRWVQNEQNMLPFFENSLRSNLDMKAEVLRNFRNF